MITTHVTIESAIDNCSEQRVLILCELHDPSTVHATIMAGAHAVAHLERVAAKLGLTIVGRFTISIKPEGVL